MHDPSDIRKEYLRKLENLGKVKSLKNHIINGYGSFNTVVVDVFGKNLRLLDTEIYSNRSPDYVTKDELKKQEKECSNTATDDERIRYKVYQDVRCVLSWGNKLGKDAVVKIQLIKRDGTAIFKQPLLLLTNYEVLDKEIAFDIIVYL